MKRTGMLLLGIWLIIQGLIPLVGISFHGMRTLMAALAIAAGVLVIMDR